MLERVKVFQKRLIHNIKRPEMRILPGQLAFFFILTMIPLIALIGLVASRFHLEHNILDNMLMSNFPKSVNDFINSIVVPEKVGIEAVAFYISALFLASRGTFSMILASNEIYRIKNSNYLRTVIKSLFMMFILIFLLIFVILVPMFGSFIVDFFISIGIDAKHIFIRIYEIIKFPFSFIVMFMAIKLLYTMAPDKHLPSREVNYGAIFTSFIWLIFTQLYSLYLKIFPTYINFYGGISGVIVLMWWIYFLAYFFVLGMALNVSKYESLAKDEK